MPITNWLLCADHQLASMCRSVTSLSSGSSFGYKGRCEELALLARHLGIYWGYNSQHKRSFAADGVQRPAVMANHRAGRLLYPFEGADKRIFLDKARGGYQEAIKVTLSTKRRSGFVLRLLSLVALGLALLFSALVIIDNSEIQKVIPPTPFRSLALFFGYTVAIMSFNYLSALKGGNLMGWRVELAVVTIAVLLFAASFLPFAFPIETRLEAGRFGGLFGKTQTQSNPDWRYSWIALVAAPLAMYVILRLRKMPLWQKTMQQGGIFKVEARSDQEPNH